MEYVIETCVSQFNCADGIIGLINMGEEVDKA